MPDDQEPSDIEVERIASGSGDGPDGTDGPSATDDEFEAIDTAVRRLLINDEARIMSVVSVGLMAIGTVFAAGWFLLAWRVEHDLDSANGVVGGAGDPDVVDRVIALMQIGGILMLFLLVLATGCGLRLYASRVFTSDDG